MSFTAYQYYILLIVAFLGYWAIPSLKIRRRYLVLMSFVFYALWNYRFFSLLLISASSDFIAAKLISSRENPRTKKLIVVATLLLNFGLLAYFKYVNFFMESFNWIASAVGQKGYDFTLHVALPLGISFYTFHTVSYTIDVYKGKAKPIHNFWDYFLFVGYFPQLVAGPIARVNALYPQFFVEKKLEFGRTAEAILTICFGMFLKVLVADTLGPVAEFVFEKPELDAGLAWLGVFAFGFQIYVDFWAYTLIARGSSQLFGIELNQNFRHPYLSKSPTEFWRRWHMSLSAWFRDYVYIPLGGNQSHENRNLLITMTIAGLWHGSNFLFVLWGVYHGLLLVITKRLKLPAVLSWPLTFLLTNLGWIFFRSQSLEQAGRIFRGLVQFAPFDHKWGAALELSLFCIALTLVLDLCFEHWNRIRFRTPESFNFMKLSIAGVLLFLVVYMGESSATPFIYFNF